MAAQYSLQYSAGVAIAKEARGPVAYAQENLFDHDVRTVAGRTRLEVDDEMDRLYPAHFAARALVTTTDGRALERTVIDPHGTPADPCTAEEIEAKFTRLASQVKKPDTVERIRSAARQLVAATGLDVFSQALRAP